MAATDPAPAAADPMAAALKWQWRQQARVAVVRLGWGSSGLDGLGELLIGFCFFLFFFIFINGGGHKSASKNAS